MDKELKPCPLCGSKEIDILSFGISCVTEHYFCYCKKCIAVGPDKKTKHLAIKAWNKSLREV